MLSWRHTGFHVHIGARIWPEDENALGNLAKYIIRASFSQERMLYISAEKSADGVAKVVCNSKDGKTGQTFDALDWLARIVVHIPNKYEQLVRYVWYYSNKSRGMRKKAEADDAILSIAPGETTSKQFRRSRAMLIQKIYEVDPLCCPNCQNQMRIVSILEAGPPVKKILEHLDLWDTRNHDPPNEDLSHILRTRLRRFGLPNPAIRLLGLSPSLSEKKSKPGPAPDCGPKQAVSHVFRDISDFRKPCSIHRQSLPIPVRIRRPPVRPRPKRDAPLDHRRRTSKNLRLL